MTGRLHEVISREVAAGMYEGSTADQVGDNIIRALDVELVAPALMMALRDCNIDCFPVETDVLDDDGPVVMTIEGETSLVALAKRLIEVLNADPVEAETDEPKD